MKTTHQTVRLSPPKIAHETISQKIISTRPMRDGKFNISVEDFKGKNAKTLVHCYGHGGSGWATLFGSVERAIQLFETRDPDKKSPIHVVGSGCMGLTSAIELARRGYKVAKITTKSLYDIPSWDAGGYFAIVSVKTSTEEQLHLNEIGMRSFLAYKQIEEGKHPYLSSTAVRYTPVYCHVATEAGIEDIEKRGLIPPREEVTLDFGNGVIHPHYLKYMTYYMNVTDLMKQLWKEISRIKIPIEIREIHTFDELQEENIFNCTGLGSITLNKDPSLIPVRGHLITLNDAAGIAHMDYMIYTSVIQEGKEECIYLFPKDLTVSTTHQQEVACMGVLGGTFIQNADRLSAKEQQELDQREFQRMLDRHSLFFQGHPYGHRGVLRKPEKKESCHYR